MKKAKRNKAKRVLGALGTGFIATGAVIPVIACGGDETTNLFSQDIQEYLNDVNAKIGDVTVSQGGIQDLPAATKGTKWVYSVDGGVTFQDEAPETLVPEQQITIKLVSNDPELFLPENVEIEKTVAEKITVNAATKQALDNISIYSNGMIQNLPNIQNAHLEYSISDTGNYTANLPDNLDANEIVLVRLTADVDYELSSEDAAITTSRITVLDSEITIDDALLNEFQTTYAINAGDSPLKNLPSAPEFTHWEYDFGLNYESKLPSADLLEPGKMLAVRLVADENHYLSQEVQRTDVEIRMISFALEDLNDAFKKVVIDRDSGLQNLPATPEDTFWMYVRGNNTDFKAVPKDVSSFPNDLQVGEEVHFKLAVTAGKLPLDMEAPQTVTVSSVIVVDAASLGAELALSTIGATSSTTSLPDAPANTHWEYQVNGGEFTSKFPTGLKGGQEITVGLFADKNYSFAQEVSSVFKVTERINLDDQFQADLIAAKVYHGEGATNLPAAPTGTHWEYQINGIFTGIYTSDVKFSSGQEVIFTLVANNNNYELDQVVESDKKLVTVAVPDAAALQNAIDNNLVFSYEKQQILNMPEAPENTHWEYSVDKKPFSDTEPILRSAYFDGSERFELVIKLVANEPKFGVLETEVSRTISAAGIVSTNGYQEALVALDNNDDNSLPSPPNNAHWMASWDAEWVTPTSGPRYLHWLEPDENWILSEPVQAYLSMHYNLIKW